VHCDQLRSLDSTTPSSYVSRRDAELFLISNKDRLTTTLTRDDAAELFLISNKDRLTTMLTRTLTAAAQQAAGADNSQQADIYLKAGTALGPSDIVAK